MCIRDRYKSLMQLAANGEKYYKTIVAWIQGLLEDNPDFAVWVSNAINEYYQDALTWLSEKLMPQLQVAVQAVTGGLLGIFTFVKNLLIGIIVSVYLLATKEHFAAIGCKLTYTALSESRAAWFIRGVKATNRIFSGFVRGKLLDSLIIGILCFFFSSLFQFPYAPLVSVVAVSYTHLDVYKRQRDTWYLCARLLAREMPPALSGRTAPPLTGLSATAGTARSTKWSPAL